MTTHPTDCSCIQCQEAFRDKNRQESERTMNVPLETFVDTLEWLYDLRGEWDWKKKEPRCGYQTEYESLCKTIFELELIQKLIQKEFTQEPKP